MGERVLGGAEVEGDGGREEIEGGKGKVGGERFDMGTFRCWIHILSLIWRRLYYIKASRRGWLKFAFGLSFNKKGGKKKHHDS